MPLLHRKSPSWFLLFSIVGVFAAFIGFGKTFFAPMAAGTFTAPVVIHVHGMFAFAWVLLFLLQTSLIHFWKRKVHEIIGYGGIIVAVGVTITMIPAGMFVVMRDLQQGMGESAYSSLIGVMTSGIMFFVLVMAGVKTRWQPDYHKRFMLLSTIVVLWPAWFRFRHYFPSIPHPDFWFALVLADIWIVATMIREMVKFKKIHPVTLYGGLFIIFEQTIEVFAFDSSWWRPMAKSLFELLTYLT